MKQTIYPQKFNKKNKAPASKSAMQRAVAMAVLSKSKTILTNPSLCNDSLAVLKIAENLGFKVIRNSEKTTIIFKDNPINNKINCGESGLGVRMFSPILALFDKNFIVTGKGSLLIRPVDIIKQALNKLGVECETNNGFLPLKIFGKLKGGKAKIDGSLSSQVLTGLLIALASAENNSEIIVDNLKSKPYIDLTISMMKNFGVIVENQNYEIFKIKGRQKYKAETYNIEGDWSGGAFLLVAGLIAGKSEVENLSLDSMQADKKIISAIKLANGTIKTTENLITTEKSKLSAFEFDATDCPDLFPPLVCMAAYCKGITKIKGVSRLTHKESNRALVLQKEFAKIGIEITLFGDYMYITGSKVTGGAIDSNNDHRIAMAGAIAALGAEEKTIIENAESINKSYPDFYQNIINK